MKLILHLQVAIRILSFLDLLRLSDALTSNYLNWDGTNHVDCLSDPALTTSLVFESQTLSSQSERPLVPSSIIKRFLIDFLTKESSPTSSCYCGSSLQS